MTSDEQNRHDFRKHLSACARREMSGCLAEAARCESDSRGASWGPRSERVGSGKNVFETLNVEVIWPYHHNAPDPD